MSLYDMANGVIRIDSTVNQISKAVAELNRQNIPKPFKVMLTHDQLVLLRMETKNSLTWVEDNAGDWSIHGCKIELESE